MCQCSWGSDGDSENYMIRVLLMFGNENSNRKEKLFKSFLKFQLFNHLMNQKACHVKNLLFKSNVTIKIFPLWICFALIPCTVRYVSTSYFEIQKFVQNLLNYSSPAILQEWQCSLKKFGRKKKLCNFLTIY